jgi:glyoxylase I family protein
MAILSIDHVNLAGDAALMEECRRFYVDILGLEEGHRPPFRSRGFWLYANGNPIVHLTVTADEAGPTGAFNHVALACSDAPAMIARLRNANVEHRVTGVPDGGATQIFLRDPAGVAVELNFT